MVVILDNKHTAYRVTETHPAKEFRGRAFRVRKAFGPAMPPPNAY